MPSRNLYRHFFYLLTLLTMSVGLAGCPFDGDDDDAETPPPAASSDADLASLTVSEGSLDPAFSSAVTDYAVMLAHAVESISVTATTSDASATLTVNGTATSSGSASAPVDLPVGTTQIDIVVTAEDGTTTKSYAVNVTREASSDASLSALALSVTMLNESFDAALNTYTADVENSVDSTTVTATASDASATIAINGTAVASGAASDPVPLAVGDNLITVVVTAEDGTTTEGYTITVTRGEPPVVTSSVDVLVLDADGRLVQGAILNVESSGETDTTGTDGRASVPVIQQSRELIRISAPGYLPQTLPLNLPADARPSVFKVGLIAEADPQQIVAAESGGTATGTDGASVTLPAGALVDAAGNPVTGAVDVYVTPLDVSNERALVAFPGGFEAENASGEAGFMLSFGTVDFRFEQGGAELSIADGQTATIELPLYVPNDADSTALTEGVAIALWSLDETTSLWIEEGQGTVVASAASPTGLALRGDVTHFSWWNADRFRRPGEIRVTLNCNGLGASCTGASDVPRSNLACNPSGDGVPRFVWRTVITRGGSDSNDIVLAVPGDTNLDCDAEADGRLSATTNPDPVNAPVGTVVPVEILLSPAYAGTEAFTPGERLRGEMLNVGDTQVWRFNGIAGEIFRVTAYPAENGLSEPGLTGELGATVAVFSGTTELESAIFESTIAGEIELELPATGEYEVRFTADGKVPGWYVATTELDAPVVGTTNLRVAFTGLDTSRNSFTDRLFTVPSGASPFLELSRDFIPSNAGGVKIQGPGFEVLQKPFYREVAPGTVVYLADHNVAGRFELFMVQLDDPGNAVKLSGPEMDRDLSTNEISDFEVSPADPTLIVYSVFNNEALGQLYLVDTDDPGNPVRLAEPADYPNYDGEQRPFRFVAGGTAIVYQANSTVTTAQAGDGQLFMVELANPDVATRVNGPVDEAAGEHLRFWGQAGAVSADGNLIAYSVRTGGDSGVPFVVDLNNPGNAVQIEDDNSGSAAAKFAFSPDQTKLVYLRERFEGDSAGQLWFADITDPAAPGTAQGLAGTADRDKWFVSPGSDYVVFGRSRSTVIQRVEFAAPDVRENWDLPPANPQWSRLRFTPDGQGILVQVNDPAARQAQLWLHRWADDRGVQTRLGPSPDSLLQGDRGVSYFDLADDGTVYYTADVGSINTEDEIFATSLTAPDTDRVKIAEWHDTFTITQDPNNNVQREPSFIILDAGQNSGP